MTQENKLEMIDYLTDELANECEKLGMAYAFSINVDDDVALSGFGGETKDMVEAVASLENVIEEEIGMPLELAKAIAAGIKECNCPKCRAKSNEAEESDPISDSTLIKFLDALFQMSQDGDSDDRN